MLRRIDLNLDLELSFEMARQAALMAARKEEIEPTLLSWYDHRHNTHSPNYLSGKDNDTIVRNFADRWGGDLEIDVNDDYAFIFMDGIDYVKHDSSPYRNIEGTEGNWYMCLYGEKKEGKVPEQQSCTPLLDTSRGG